MAAGFAKQVGIERDQLGLVIILSMAANTLALGTSLYSIQVFNRYIGFGIDGTLLTLTVGAFLFVTGEWALRRVRGDLLVRGRVERERREARDLAAEIQAAVPAVPREAARARFLALERLQQIRSPSTAAVILDAPATVLFALFVALLNWKLGLVLLFGILVTVVLGWRHAERMRRWNLAEGEAREAAFVARSNAGQTELLRTFNLGAFALDWFEATQKRTQAARLTKQNAQLRLQSSFQSVTAVLVVLVIGIGAREVGTSSLDLGGLIGANILAARAIGFTSRAASLIEPLSQARRDEAFLDRHRSAPVSARILRTVTLTGHLSARELSFTHEGAARCTAQGLNLSIEPGSCVLVTGPNGIGKSTFARILTGMIRPDHGQVLVDGIDLRQIDPVAWFKQVIYLPQEPQFLTASLRDNLRALVPSATDEMLIEACETVGIDGFVKSDPAGLDRTLRNGGIDLSLSTRRKLALVRAHLSGGQYVFVDEPTEGFDQTGIAAVQRLLSEYIRGGKTVFLFSSDRRVLKNPDVTIDLDGQSSRVIASGASERIRPLEVVEGGS